MRPHRRAMWQTSVGWPSMPPTRLPLLPGPYPDVPDYTSPDGVPLPVERYGNSYVPAIRLTV